MKILLTGLLFICVIRINAQNILTAENPVSKQYRVEHFGLKGKVMSVTEPYSDGKKTLNFDNNGRLTMEITEDSVRTYFNETWTYKYDSTKKIFSRSKGGTIPTTNYYTIDSIGNVTAMFFTSSGNMDVLFMYKNNLLKTALYYEKNTGGAKTVSKRYEYNYNESGQVISEVYLNEKKDTVTIKNYNYIVTDGNTLVSIDNASWMNVYRNKKTWVVKKYYDKNNSLLKVEEIASTNTISYEYKSDAVGNWIQRDAYKRQIIYRK